MDEVFGALADPHRRTILDRLHGTGGLTLGQLCEGLAMTRQAVSKHLAVLEGAHLVTAVKRGRERLHFLNPAPIGEINDRFLASGVMELKAKLGPINWQFMPTKAFDPADFEAFLQLLPTSHAGRALRHAVEVRHDSFRSPDFVALARKHGVAIVVAGDSEHPLIDEPTADFVYARVMGTQEGEALGYPAKTLDSWAQRAKGWAGGKRDVFLYVISGHKVSNPTAAMALIERVR